MNQFILPDLFALVPFSAIVNPHHKRASAESSAWMDSFNFFVDQKRSHFIRSNIELLMAHAYSYSDYEDFRTIADYANVLFTLDEISDEQDGKAALVTAEISLKALAGEECEHSGTPLYRFVSELVPSINSCFPSPIYLLSKTG